MSDASTKDSEFGAGATMGQYEHDAWPDSVAVQPLWDQFFGTASIQQSQSTVENDVRISRIIFVGRNESSIVRAPTVTPASTSKPLSDGDDFNQLVDVLAVRWANEDVDGMEQSLQAFIDRFGPSGIVALTVAALQQKIEAPLLADVLDFVERIDSPLLRKAPAWMMRKFLSHPSAGVRYAALSGILTLDDRSALQLLEDAVQNEPVSELRREISRGIEHLSAL